MAEVWYAIPSANPALCRAHMPAWRERGYRVAVLQNRERAEIPADLIVWSDRYPGWAASVNQLCAHEELRSADIVVTGGDDMLPVPDRGAEELAGEFHARFPDTFGVMQPVGDAFMHAREYCGSPWLGRAWIDHAYAGSGPLHAGYAHNWADHELRWVSEALGALWLRDDVAQHHAHFSRNGQSAPEYWDEAVRPHDRADVENFMARLWAGFPGHESRGHSVDRTWWAERYTGTAHRHWASRYADGWLSGGDDRRLGGAIAACARDGARRVGVFGAGTATREAPDALREPGVTVDCLIDDHPSLAGGSLWGFPIVSLSEAVGRGLDAVIVHARGEDEQMLLRARQAFGGAVSVRSSRVPVDHTPQPAPQEVHGV